MTLPQGPSTTDEDGGAPGFFGRNRVIRPASGLVISIVLIAAYLFGIQSYRAGLSQDFPQQTPPTGGSAWSSSRRRSPRMPRSFPRSCCCSPGATCWTNPAS